MPALFTPERSDFPKLRLANAKTIGNYASHLSSLEAFQTRTLDPPNLDFLGNNEGINRVDSADGLDDEDWSTVIDVN